MLSRLGVRLAETAPARWIRPHVKRGIYAFGAARRLSYKVWTPGEMDHALANSRALIHVGANEGQERYIYESMGLEVLWVEPVPAVFARLAHNIRGLRKQRATNALLSDTPGRKLMLHISNNGGQSSSIFELAEHKAIWPEVHYVDRIECASTTLDELSPILPSPDALVLDTQGSELMVLAGGERTLSQVCTIKTEAADFKAYDGGCTDAEIVAFLEARGFELADRRCFAQHPAGGRYFDLVFRKVHSRGCAVA
jgi:FkbM family methyltransferase